VEKEPVPAPPAAASTVTPAAVPRPKRCVLLTRAASPEEASALVASADRHGFTEVWFQVTLTDPGGATALLAAAVAAGREKNMPIGAAFDLLRGKDLPADPDRNILGETGAEFALRRKERKGASALSGYVGWVAPDRDATARIAALAGQVASVPGLACLAVRASAAPGGARMPADDPNSRFRSSGIPPNGCLGYTDARRVAFLREKGIDPIDVPDLGPLKRLVSLPFFPNSTDTWEGRIGPSWGRDPSKKVVLTDWRESRFRAAEDTTRAIYEALRQSAPTLPLLIDDRAGAFVPEVWGSWFVSWEPRVALPRNQSRYPRAEGLKQARASGARLVLNRTDFGEDPAKPVSLRQFAERTREALAYTVKERWDGIVIDQSHQESPETLRRLEALPVIPAPERTAGQ
jgi:hypothetical protein